VKHWLIWSNEHCAWWKANERGYTYYFDEAGLYSPDDVRRIVTNANIGLKSTDRPNEVGILIEDTE